MLLQLPLELILDILPYLTVQDLACLQQTCKDWKTLIDKNESSIYHNAAIRHRFIDSVAIELSSARVSYARRFMEDAVSWKEFCKRRCQLEKNWLGRGPSEVKQCEGASKGVHRIKVDEQAGFAITTYGLIEGNLVRGGLRVTDLSTSEVLWDFPQAIRPYAHCEYSNGFLVFDRMGGSKEVWRHAVDYDPNDVPQSYPPDPIQQWMYTASRQRYTSDDVRGHFRPWALLTMPSETRAYRFVYPTLLVAGFSEAYLWDIPSATHIQTVIFDMPIDDNMLLSLNYVELSSRYIFLCGSESLQIFSRDEGRLVLDITQQNALDEVPVMQIVVEETSSEPETPYGSALLPQTDYNWVRSQATGIGSNQQFRAVHVSSDERDMVILLDVDSLIVVRDFQRLIRREASFADSVVRMTFISEEHGGVYLAFENGKVGVATEEGIFVITVDPTLYCLSPISSRITSCETSSEYPFPNISVCRALRFNQPSMLADMGCLQMTETGLYFTWDPRAFKHEHNPYSMIPDPVWHARLFYIDFTVMPA